MKHILVPTDFSENAWNALKYGLELFTKTNCTFYLMHVNPVPGYSDAGTSLKKSSGKLADVLIENSLKNLQALIDELEKLPLNNNHTFLPLVYYGYFTDTVNRVVKDKNIDLILMGTKGATGLKKATIGSNTGDVITKVKCPLLAVPENALYEKLKEIAFPTDFRLGNDFNALDTLLEMVKINDASLSILNVKAQGEELDPDQHKNKNVIQNYLDDIKHSFHTLTATKLDSAVQCFTESRDIDMIAMVAKNVNFFQRILFRPTVEKISYHTKVPFLTLCD